MCVCVRGAADRTPLLSPTLVCTLSSPALLCTGSQGTREWAPRCGSWCYDAVGTLEAL